MTLGEWLAVTDFNSFVKIVIYQDPHEKHYCTAEPCSDVLRDLRDRELKGVYISTENCINMYLKEK